MSQSNIIGEKLRKLRGERSSSEVSEALGISLSALSMYENGNRIPRDEVKVAIANYYNVPVQDIFLLLEERRAYNRGRAWAVDR